VGAAVTSGVGGGSKRGGLWGSLPGCAALGWVFAPPLNFPAHGASHSVNTDDQVEHLGGQAFSRHARWPRGGWQCLRGGVGASGKKELQCWPGAGRPRSEQWRAEKGALSSGPLLRRPGGGAAARVGARPAGRFAGRSNARRQSGGKRFGALQRIWWPGEIFTGERNRHSRHQRRRRRPPCPGHLRPQPP
jgi:hypothetical protein